MIKGVAHTGIIVSNMDASVQFYTDVLGLDLLQRIPAGPVELGFLGVDGETVIELIAIDPFEIAAEGRINHLAFKVDHIE